MEQRRGEVNTTESNRDVEYRIGTRAVPIRSLGGGGRSARRQVLVLKWLQADS